jgi:hypothetical protein
MARAIRGARRLPASGLGKTFVSRQGNHPSGNLYVKAKPGAGVHSNDLRAARHVLRDRTQGFVHGASLMRELA